jgi:hypothetical protein
MDGPAGQASAKAGKLVAAYLLQGDNLLSPPGQPRRDRGDPLRLIWPARRDALTPVLGMNTVQDIPGGHRDHGARS